MAIDKAKLIKKLTVYVGNKVHRDVKVMAAKKELSLTQYTLKALLEQLRKDTCVKDTRVDNTNDEGIL